MTRFSEDPDFLDLIAVWHENREFSQERKEQLLARLTTDPDLRREFAREVQMAALTGTVQRGEAHWFTLEEKLAPEREEGQTVIGEDSVMRRIDGASLGKGNTGWMPWFGIAAAVTILAAAIFLHGRMRGSGFDESLVARVIRIDHQENFTAARSLSAGAFLRAGEKLVLNEGLVEMAFLDTGVHVIATAPLALTMKSRDEIFVHDGEVKLHVPPQGVGFVVETPERRITDLGTSFVVKARDESSKVLVLDGQIAVADPKGGEDNYLFEGDVADFGRNGEIALRSRQASGVPERLVPSPVVGPESLAGILIGFRPGDPGVGYGDDPMGSQLLPLIRSGFQDESSLDGLIRKGPLRFSGIAGTYDRFPEMAGMDSYKRVLGWMAWYHGELNAPAPGRYRFWGYADNHLLVAVNGRPVFEGSRNGSRLSTELAVARQNHPSLPCLNAAAGFASGEWFEVAGDPVRIDLIFGEQKMNITSGLLLIEYEEGDYEETSWGQPEWPLFLTETPTDPEQLELRKIQRHMEDKLMGSFSVDESAVWRIATRP